MIPPFLEGHGMLGTAQVGVYCVEGRFFGFREVEVKQWIL